MKPPLAAVLSHHTQNAKTVGRPSLQKPRLVLVHGEDVQRLVRTGVLEHMEDIQTRTISMIG